MAEKGLGPREWSPRKAIPRVFNITEEILREAERLGLDAMATGGGNDFISKEVGENEDGSPRFLVLSAGDTSGSPDRLSEKSDLLVMLNENWTDQVAMSFKTAKEAMAAMARTYDPYA